jgi:quinol monooxygenase YgiN
MYTLINEFTVTGDVEEFRAVLADFNAYMSALPGSGAYRLFRSTKRPDVFIELAEWESAEAHLAAVKSEGFGRLVGRLRPLISIKQIPDLYETVHETIPA